MSVVIAILKHVKALVHKAIETQLHNLSLNIYIFVAIALDETSILVAVYFSMQNIYQSCNLVCAVRRSNVDANQ